MDHIQKLLSYLFSAMMESDTLAMFPSSNFLIFDRRRRDVKLFTYRTYGSTINSSLEGRGRREEVVLAGPVEA